MMKILNNILTVCFNILIVCLIFVIIIPLSVVIGDGAICLIIAMDDLESGKELLELHVDFYKNVWQSLFSN